MGLKGGASGEGQGRGGAQVDVVVEPSVWKVGAYSLLEGFIGEPEPRARGGGYEWL